MWQDDYEVWDIVIWVMYRCNIVCGRMTMKCGILMVWGSLHIDHEAEDEADLWVMR